MEKTKLFALIPLAFVFAVLFSGLSLGQSAPQNPNESDAANALKLLAQVGNGSLSEVTETTEGGSSRFVQVLTFDATKQTFKVEEKISFLHNSVDFGDKESLRTRIATADFSEMGTIVPGEHGVSISCSESRECFTYSDVQSGNCDIGDTDCLSFAMTESTTKQTNYAFIAKDAQSAKRAALALQILKNYNTDVFAVVIESPSEVVERIYGTISDGRELSNFGLDVLAIGTKAKLQAILDSGPFEIPALEPTLAASQDPVLDNLQFRVLDQDNAVATVRVNFDNYDGSNQIRVEMQLEDGVWKVVDACNDKFDYCYTDILSDY